MQILLNFVSSLILATWWTDLYIIETKKHLQCETLLGLARESTKKRRNKKFGECITTIRYNVIHMYCFWKLMLWCFLANPFTL